MTALERQTGSTLLELAVAGAIIGVLAAILLGQLMRYQEIAEKTVMETTVINMRTGLKWRMAELMVSDRMQDLGAVAQDNPVDWLAAPPSNYLGPLAAPAPDTIPPGSWYYDTESRQLVYRPDRARHLKPGPDGEKLIRFRVTATTHPAEKGRPPRVEGVTLSPVVPYDWPIF